MSAPCGIGDAADRLRRVADLAGQFDLQIARDARTASERIAEGRFYVACVGQFKRGKSALLNALIGEEILPTGVIPVTAIPTILRFGEVRAARARQQDGNWTNISVDEIEQYVSEENNPENRKQISVLEVFVPSSLLTDGMCLVDTPGLGSVFPGNTAATHAFLPHIDAAIVVIGADPPIAGEELALVQTVSQRVSHLLFVLNKADRVNEAERAAAISFAKQVLETRLSRSIPSIFQVSALETLSSKGPQRDWQEFVDSLRCMAEQSGQQLVRDAAARSLWRFSEQLFVTIKEQRDALTRPFAESEHRLDQIRNIVLQAEQALNDLSYVFTGEQNRLSKTFAERRNLFLKPARASAQKQLDASLHTLPRAMGPHYRRRAMQAAQDVARAQVMPWLESETKNARDAYRQIAQRFTGMANEFLAKVRGFGAELTALPKELNFSDNLGRNSTCQFYEFVHVAMPASPARYAGDFLCGLVRWYSLIDADAREFLDRLLETNSERVRNDLEHRVADNRRQLETEIRKMLQQLSVVSEHALERARDAHAAGAETVKTSLEKLDAARSELMQLTAPSATLVDR
jgi:hypothetical protein